jgi:hypothetical protein
MSQYEVWPGPEERLGDDALIFSVGGLPAQITECFEKTKPLGRVEVPLGEASRIFEVFLGHRLKTWKKVGAQ